MLKEITQYIENETDWQVGEDLFAGFRSKDAPVRCLTVLDNSGGQAHYSLPDAGDKLIQIVSKSDDYFEARSDLQFIHDLLHGSSGVTLPQISGGTIYLINVIEAVNLPQGIGKNENGEFEFSVNFIFRYQTGG
jgi:Bacteriophage minor capsid protein